MSPERSSSPLSHEERALTPRVSNAPQVDNISDVQEADAIGLDASNQIAAESSVVSSPLSNDDDLTSLSWLQDRNLLKGMNLSKSETEESSFESGKNVIVNKTPEYVQSHRSPTSDYVDESSTSAGDSSSSSLNSPVSCANFSPRNKHPHNVPYDPKVHTTSKPPYSFSCLIFMAIEDSEQKALPVKEIYAWILEHFPYFKNAPTGWKNSVRHNLSLNKCFQKVEKAPNLGKGSLWMVDQQFRPNLMQALTRSPVHPSLDACTYYTLPRSSSASQESKHLPRLPNPELFPYLSRRLAASEIKTETSDDSQEAVDAANVMLALKHGPKILKERRRRSTKSQNPLELVQVITTSPSEDHTYSAATSFGSRSPDEAFESDDSQTISEYAMKHFARFPKVDIEEQRKIAEGADALLNLAGITTIHRSTKSNRNANSNEQPETTKRKRTSKSTHNLEPVQERPSQFRPRLLRTKWRNESQKRKITNNNNNNIHKKLKMDSTNEEWMRYRKVIEESRNLR